MTNSTEKATWPHAIGCYFGGAVLTSFVAATVFGILRSLAEFGVAVYSFQLFGAVVVAVAVPVATRLPQRARAMFVAGVCTPIALTVVAFLWLLWAFSHSNLTF